MAKTKSGLKKPKVTSDSLVDNYDVTDIIETEFKDGSGQMKIKKTYYKGDKVVGEEIKNA